MHPGTRVPGAKDLRDALARGERRYEHEVAAVQAFDRANLRERGMIEGVKGVDALAQRVFETARAAELRSESEQLERRRAAVVEHEQAVTDRVAEAFGVPAGQRSGGGRMVPSSDRGVAARRHKSSLGVRGGVRCVSIAECAETDCAQNRARVQVRGL